MPQKIIIADSQARKNCALVDIFSRNPGFTLIELPLVIAIIAILAALLPASTYAATLYAESGSFHWDTSTLAWGTSSGGPFNNTAWSDGSIAYFGKDVSPAPNPTLYANITINGITQIYGASGVTIGTSSTAYSLILGATGANTFLAAANDTTSRILTINAGIAGGSGNNLVLAGPGTSSAGTISLLRANTFSGNTSFSAGATGGIQVYLKHQLAFQNSTVILSPDVNLIFDSSVTTNAFSFGGLSASSAGTGYDLALQNNAATPIALTVGANTNTTTYSGVLSGGGSLIKTGNGTLVLDGVNTYTGATVINGGILQVDGTLVSPITVNGGATLDGGGLVNAAVSVAAGGSVTAGDGTGGGLAVSRLTFNGTGTINVGTLSGYTSAAAIVVSNALTLNGGAGALMLNLPTALGYNGTYHLVRFGSGIANASGFALGTFPALAGNQSGILQINGNYLDYVITAVGDTTPPVVVSLLPANNATNVVTDANLVATFNETIVAGSGNIELHKMDGTLVESYNVTSSPQLAFSTAQLIINPTSVLASNQQYYVLIPFGTVKDTAGNTFAGITNSTGWRFTVPVPVVLYTDSGSPTNPPWIQVSNTVASAGYLGKNYPGPVYGSAINVNNAAVETGLYGNRPISVGSMNIHVACNTAANNFANFTRWFQIDGNTHVLRVFQNDQNVATSRSGVSSHTEAYATSGWNYTDNATHEWTGHYTEAHIKQGFAAFQLKNSDNDWAFQLSMGSDGTLNINNRRSADVPVTNPDGSAKNFTGRGFDMRVLDDGLNYKVWIDGVLYASSSYSRPTGTTVFRWGMYFGANNLHPPSDYNLILISGAQTQSWPGTLASSVTQIVKANNTTNLDNGTSWSGGTTPGLYNQAVWNNTVTSANVTTLANKQEWSGIQILNPGGAVTINGTSTLVLDALGVDLTAATQNLTVNCPVQMTVSNTCGVATGRTATFNGVISGFPGLTVNGGGTVQSGGANTYSGDTTISAGRLVTSTANALSPGTSVIQSGGGQLFLNAPGTYNQNMNLSTTGFSEGDTLSNVDGAIRAEYTSTLGGTITLSGNSRIGNANSGNLETISGQITGGYGLDFYGMNNLGNNQAHVFVLSNPANNYSGNTAIYCNDYSTAKTGNSTTLRMGGPVVIPSGSSAGNVVFNGADANHLTILDLNGNTQIINGTTVAAAAGAQITNSAATTPATLIIGAGDTTSTFSGVIADKGSGNLISLTKQGAGTLTLSGANTYGGGTVINGGTLLASNTGGSATGTGAVNINSGGTLGGTGIISGPVTNNAGGTLSPGAGVGTLTLSGSLVLNPGSTNLFEVNGTTPTNDVVVLGGTVTYGGVLKIVPTGTFTVGQTFRLFSGAGATGPGNFSSLQGSPGSGKLFTFTNSVLTVVAAGPSGPARLTNSYSGGVLSLSWPAGQGWRLQMQTNSLSVGLRRNWIYITDGTISSTNIAISPTQPAVFFRLTYP